MNTITIVDKVDYNIGWLFGNGTNITKNNNLKHFSTIKVNSAFISVYIDDDFSYILDNANKWIELNITEHMQIFISGKTGELNTKSECICQEYGIQVVKSYDSKLPDKHYRHHKIGGYPTLQFNNEVSIPDNYEFIYQLCFPGGDDCDVDVNWPFGDLIFSLFKDSNHYKGLLCYLP